METKFIFSEDLMVKLLEETSSMFQLVVSEQQNAFVKESIIYINSTILTSTFAIERSFKEYAKDVRNSQKAVKMIMLGLSKTLDVICKEIESPANKGSYHFVEHREINNLVQVIFRLYNEYVCFAESIPREEELPLIDIAFNRFRRLVELDAPTLIVLRDAEIIAKRFERIL